jgi:hypothetical protein
VTTAQLTFDQPAYPPGAPVKMTVSYADSGSAAFQVPVTVTVVDPANPSDSVTVSDSYTVQPPAAAMLGVQATDAAGGTWAMASNTPGTAVLAGTAASAAPAPAVPSGFGGTEPPLSVYPGAVTWAGYTWEPMDWGTAPGQPKGSQVSIDAQGRLVLTASTVSGTYAGAELDSARGDRGVTGNASTWGYGKYRWVIGTDLTTLPPNMVLGFFTYWAMSKGGPAGQKEIDIEIGPMGIPAAPSFMQLGFYQDTAAHVTQAVPVLHTLVPGSQFVPKSVPVTTAEFEWMPDHITWRVWYGTDTSGTPDDTLTMTQGQPYTYTQEFGGNAFAGTVEIPAAGGHQVIMNLWCAGNTPPPSSDAVVVVIESFTYIQP